MGFYFRKSIKFGPLRFNLSKSGIGVSTGIKGFRVGTGPRGNYIQAGMGGIYYRTTLPSGSREPAYNPNAIANPELIDPSSMVEVESTSALNLVDQNSADLLAELNAKHKLITFWPVLAGASALAIIFGATNQHLLWYILGALLGIAAVPIFYLDQQRKTTVLFYNLEPPVLPAFEAVFAAFEQLSNCRKIWVVDSVTSVTDKKYQAGADNIVNRSATHFSVRPPPYIQTNISIPCLKAGKQNIYLFPDKILVYDRNGIGAVSYDSLTLHSQIRNHIESDSVPNDSKVVGNTWRYVNKDGGRDRRFKDNYEVPIAAYDNLQLSSDSGLNEIFQFSRCGLSEGLIAAIKIIAKILSNPTAFNQPPVVCSSVYPDEPSSKNEPPPIVIENPPVEETTSDENNYYYFNGSLQGPVTAQQLFSLHESGTLNADSQVCSIDNQQWITMKTWMDSNR